MTNKGVFARWKRVTEPEPERCDIPRSEYSTARCEKPAGHHGFHAGRTRRGYWKFWSEYD